VHAIKIYYSNKTAMPMSQINLQVAVQKYMKLEILPATSSMMQPLAQNGITQDMKITNTLEGQKPLALKIKVNYGFDNGRKVE
jgi:AP-1 complex subunit gamma-1